MIHAVGKTYFMVSYLDDECVVPVMETLVYLGLTESDEGPRHLFQDFESWSQSGAYPNNSEGPGKVFSLPANELSNILEFRAAVAELRDCEARRGKRGLP